MDKAAIVTQLMSYDKDKQNSPVGVSMLKARDKAISVKKQ